MRLRRSVLAVVLPALRVICLLGASLVVAVAPLQAADEARVLKIDAGAGVTMLSVAAMKAQLPLLSLAVDDIEYHGQHRYEGIDFAALVQGAGFEPGAQLLLVCTDGYSIPFDSALLDDPAWQGLLALHDEAAPAGKDYVPFQHGAELVDFAPFYLVWQQRADTPSSLSAADFPWPYQLTEIRLQRPEDFAAAMPPADASATMQAGFELYFKYCLKCHSVDGAGGTLGPPLDAEHGLTGVLARNDIAERILWQSRFSRSKMPDLDETLSKNDLADLLSYLHSKAQPQPSVSK